LYLVHHLLSSYRLPPPPPSSLFPYTTLFRSQPHHAHLPRAGAPARRPLLRTGGHFPRVARRAQTRPTRPRRGLLPPARERRDHRDRKSTRLNSSHVSISYAVFCLKKKNIPHS